MIKEKNLQLTHTYKKLKEKLIIIKQRNWIKCDYIGKGTVGLKLEELLNKKRDRYILPDYHGIELKTRTSKLYGVKLFSCAFDNKPLEIERMVNILGYEQKENGIAFQRTINAKKGRVFGNYFVKIYPDYSKFKLRFLIFKGFPRKYYTEMSWSFNELETRLLAKLKQMVIVNSEIKYINQTYYVKYHNWNYYRIKNFDSFLECIKNGYINISFNITTKNNRIYDRGTNFEIEYDKLEFLFDLIE